MKSTDPFTEEVAMTMVVWMLIELAVAAVLFWNYIHSSYDRSSLLLSPYIVFAVITGCFCALVARNYDGVWEIVIGTAIVVLAWIVVVRKEDDKLNYIVCVLGGVTCVLAWAMAGDSYARSGGSNYAYHVVGAVALVLTYTRLGRRGVRGTLELLASRYNN